MQQLSWEQVREKEISTYASHMSRSERLILPFWSPTAHCFSVGRRPLFLGRQEAAELQSRDAAERKCKCCNNHVRNYYTKAAAEGWRASTNGDTPNLRGLRLPSEENGPDSRECRFVARGLKLSVLLDKFAMQIIGMKQTQSHTNALEQINK